MNNVLFLRQRLSMTQDEFADHCNVARISIARYETGAQVSRANAKKIATACGVTIGFVIGDEEKPKEAHVNRSLIEILTDLSPDEVQRVQDFVAGIRANRKA